MYNVLGLMMELAIAGIVNSGCNSDGKVWAPNGSEIQTQPDVAAVLAAHDSEVWDARVAAWKANRSIARLTAKDIPNYATWEVEDWAAWRSTRITDTQINALTIPQAAKDVLNYMSNALDGAIQLLICVRDSEMPDLEDLAGGIIRSSSMK